MGIAEVKKNSCCLKCLFILILLIKLVILGLFSSDYQNLLFLPFINEYLSYGGNPWENIYINNLPYEFPYHPLMLYIFSIGGFFIKIFNIDNIFIQNILFKFPIFLADIGVYYIFTKIFKTDLYKILIYYFLSPIILYASYIHSQLDLVPASLLFFAVYFLSAGGSRNVIKSDVLYALTICTKINALLVLPIFLTYIYKLKNKLNLIFSVIIISAIYLCFSLPYIFSSGYQHLVLNNDKQNLLFNLYVTLGNIKIYIVLFSAMLIYLRFMVYKKINKELFNLYIVLSISLFLIFVSPSTPAWFIWIVPFLSLFSIKYSKHNKPISALYWSLNCLYLIYFIFFHIGDFGDITFLSQVVNLKITDTFIRDSLFTILETNLFLLIYYMYKEGIRNNSIYKKNKAIVIGIGGNSGSGKTTLLTDIKSLLQDEIILLEGDDDHKWERCDEHWNNITHLNPKANFLQKQIHDILRLKKLKSIYRAVYNHEIGKFETPNIIEPKPFVLLSGLHTFYLPKMRRIIDFKIYLNPKEELRRFWKIERDVKFRGYSKADVISSIIKREDDFKKYIKPQKDFADLVISYFPLNDDFENNHDLSLGIEIEMNSDIDIDKLIEIFDHDKIDINWNYSDNLRTQCLTIKSQLDNYDWKELAGQLIKNSDEIIPYNSKFQKGQKGFIQLLFLLILSEKMKDVYDKEYFN